MRRHASHTMQSMVLLHDFACKVQRDIRRSLHVHAFVINLRDRTARMQAFEKRARSANMHVERADAIDTRDLSKLAAHKSDVDPLAYKGLLEDMRHGYRHAHSRLTPGAVGCALSHVAVSRLAIGRELPHIAVFEDDCELPSDAPARMEAAASAAPANWDCVLLGWNGAPPLEDGSALQRVTAFVGCHAYLLSQRGMRSLIACSTPVRTHIDHALSAEAARGRLALYGINSQEDRFLQRGRGSDVQQLVVRKRRLESSTTVPTTTATSSAPTGSSAATVTESSGAPTESSGATVSFFAYGSLMWETGLPYVTGRTPAVLRGFRRRLCLYSWAYRGTRQSPGLVLGLDAHEDEEGSSVDAHEEGSSRSLAARAAADLVLTSDSHACSGYALHVRREDEEAARRYFDARELINGIYHRRLVSVTTASGDELRAYAYVADRSHEQYCGELSLERAADLVATGKGTRGTAFEYLACTVDELKRSGVHEPSLERVLDRARDRMRAM